MLSASELKALPKSAKAAKALSQRLYYNGKRCFRGHLAARSVTNHYCEECSPIDVIEAKKRLADMLINNPFIRGNTTP